MKKAYHYKVLLDHHNLCQSKCPSRYVRQSMIARATTSPHLATWFNSQSWYKLVPNKPNVVHLNKSFMDMINSNVTSIALFHWSGIGWLIHLVPNTCEKESNMSKIQINLRNSRSLKDIRLPEIRLPLSVPIYSIAISLDTHCTFTLPQNQAVRPFINSLSAEFTFIS